MTTNRLLIGVGVFGLVASAFLALGFNNIGGIMAAFQLTLFVGSPMAVSLREELKSWRVVAAIAVVLSIGLTAISVQFLVWFEVATAPLLTALATCYSVAIGLLMSSVGAGRTRAELRESEAARSSS